MKVLSPDIFDQNGNHFNDLLFTGVVFYTLCQDVNQRYCNYYTKIDTCYIYAAETKPRVCTGTACY